MSKTIEVYFSPHCGACKENLPHIKRNAERRGESVKLVDADKCTDKVCEAIEYVPTIRRDGRILSEAEMRPYLER